MRKLSCVLCTYAKGGMGLLEKGGWGKRKGCDSKLVHVEFGCRISMIQQLNTKPKTKSWMNEYINVCLHVCISLIQAPGRAQSMQRKSFRAGDVIDIKQSIKHTYIKHQTKTMIDDD